MGLLLRSMRGSDEPLWVWDLQRHLLKFGERRVISGTFLVVHPACAFLRLHLVRQGRSIW
jgi:hypothetical protein